MGGVDQEDAVKLKKKFRFFFKLPTCESSC